MEVLKNVETPQLQGGIPDFGPGDTLRLQVKVREGDKERLQAFQGVVIQRRGSGLRESFTVRKVSDGVGVERIFPLHSPSLASIEVIKRGRVRRAKINYLKQLKGKRARIREKLPTGAKATSKKAPAKKASKKSTAKKSTAKKSTAKKSTAKKAAAKK